MPRAFPRSSSAHICNIYIDVCVLGARYFTDLFLPDLAGARCNLQVRDTINFMNVCSEEVIFSFFFSLFLFSRDLFTFLLSF